MLRSYTGAFGFGGAFCQELEELAGAVDERVRRASQAPPPPEQDAHSSGVRAAVQLPEDEEDVEPVTLDLSKDTP